MTQSQEQGIYIVRVMDGSEEILCNPVVTRFPQDTTRKQWAFKGPSDGDTQLRLRGRNEENRFDMADEFQAWNYRLLKAAYDDGKFPMFRMTFVGAGDEARIRLDEQKKEMAFKADVFKMDAVELARACAQCELPSEGTIEELQMRLLTLGYDLALRKMGDKFVYAKVILQEATSLGIFQDTNNAFSVSIGAKGLSELFRPNTRLGGNLMEAAQLLADDHVKVAEIKRMIAVRRDVREKKEQDLVPVAVATQAIKYRELEHETETETVDVKAETDIIVNKALKKGVIVKRDNSLWFNPTGGEDICLGKSKAEVLVWRETNEALFEHIKELAG